MEPVTCTDCGFSMGSLYDAYLEIKKILLISKKLETDINSNSINPNNADNSLIIFESLKINKYCCRSSFSNCMNMSDLIL